METKLAELLDKLMKAAEQLGMEGIRLWPQVVGITFVKALFWLIWNPLVAVIFCVVAWHYSRRLIRWAKQSGIEEDQHLAGAACAGMGFVALIFVVVAVSNFGSDLTAVLYPEATTVMNLAKSLK